MSQGQKAKEVRDYFIAVEKEYKANALQTDAVISEFMSMQLQQNEAQAKQNEMMMESMKLLTSLVTDMRDRQLKAPVARVNTTISAKQMDKLNNAITQAASHVAKYHKLTVPTAKRVLYGELNGRMGVSTYYQILEKDFMSAMIFVKSTGERARLEYEDINARLDEEAAKIKCGYDEEYDEGYDEEEEE